MEGLRPDRMSEAEVSLRLASHLLGRAGRGARARVAIDGAQVKVGRTTVFPLEAFLASEGWKQLEQRGRNAWQGLYARRGQLIEIHCSPGQGDVVCTIGSTTFRAECKKGPLVARPSNPEYPLLREALGQLLTVEAVGDADVLLVAVPRSESFSRRAAEWRSRPLIARSGIRIVLVGRDGRVDGLD